MPVDKATIIIIYMIKLSTAAGDHRSTVLLHRVPAAEIRGPQDPRLSNDALPDQSLRVRTAPFLPR